MDKTIIQNARFSKSSMASDKLRSRLGVKTAVPLEHTIQTHILDWLQFQPRCFYWRQNASMNRKEYKGTVRYFKSVSVPGISDIMGIWNGKPLAIEVKRPGEKLRPDQIEFLQKFSNAGGIAIVAYRVEDVIESLNQFR